MTEAILAEKDRVIGSGIAISPPQLPDTIRMAENAMLQALEFCVQEMGLDGPQAVAHRVLQGSNLACAYFRYGLAKQVAQSMGALDENIKAVYTLDRSIVPIDLSSGELPQDAQRIHLLVWMQPRTAAFDSMVAQLDRALVQAYADVLGIDDLTFLLDVQVIDDADVEKLIGCGALCASIHHRLEQFWVR